MKIEIALAQIFSEVERAEKLHPDWPTSPIHQAAIVTEEAGVKGLQINGDISLIHHLP